MTHALNIEDGNTAAEIANDTPLSDSQQQYADQLEQMRLYAQRKNRLNDPDTVISAFGPDAWFTNMADDSEGTEEISRMVRLARKTLEGDYVAQVIFIKELLQHAHDFIEND